MSDKEVEQLLDSPVVKEEYKDGFKESKGHSKTKKKRSDSEKHLCSLRYNVKFLRTYVKCVPTVQFFIDNLKSLVHRSEKSLKAIDITVLKKKDIEELEILTKEFNEQRDKVNKMKL